MEPLVKDPQRYPLPLYTYLADGLMLPTYQAAMSPEGVPMWAEVYPVSCPKGHGFVDDKRPLSRCGQCGVFGTAASCLGPCEFCVCRPCFMKMEVNPKVEIDEQGQEKKPEKVPPKWHMQFNYKKDVPMDPLLSSTIHEVLVRVLNLPGVINLQLLGILSRVPADPHHMSIFSEVSVNGINRNIWQMCVPAYWMSMGDELLLLFVLLMMGLEPPALEYVIVQNALQAVVLVSLITSVVNVAWGVTTCQRLIDLTPWRFGPLFLMRDVIGGFFLCLVLHLPEVVHTGFDKVLITVNVLVRCTLLIAQCRAIHTIGPTMMAVQKAFGQMIGMFGLMMIIFLSFFFCYIIFKDPDRSIYFVFVYLFQALVLADRDTSEAISGLDMAT